MRIKTRILIVMSVIVILTSTAFSFILYNRQKSSFLDSIDTKLILAADLVRKTLPEGYHDSIEPAESLGEPGYMVIVNQLDSLCTAYDLESVGSMLLLDSQGVITSTSSLPELNPDHPAVPLFTAFRNGIDVYFEISRTGTTRVIDKIDELGSSRTAILPATDGQNRPVLYGASVHTDAVRAQLEGVLKNSVLVGLVMMLIGVAASLLVAEIVARPLTRITSVAERIALGDLDQHVDERGSPELESLSNSFNTLCSTLTGKLSELQMSRDELLVTINSIGEAVIRTDRDGFIIGINPIAQELTGWTASEAAGRPLTDIFVVEEALNPTDDKVFLNSESTLIARDGTRKHISPSGAPIRDHDGEVLGVVVVFRDISQRFEREMQLRRSEETARALIDTTQETFMMIDSNGIVLATNMTGAERLNTTPEELVGTVIFSHFPAELAASRENILIDVIKTGKRASWEDCRDGNTYFCICRPVENATGSVSSVVLFAQNITERKQIEKDLQQSRHHLARAQATAHMGSFDYDLITDTIRWSDELLRIVGYSADELPALASERVRVTTHPDDWERVEEEYRILRERHGSSTFECRLIRKDGSVRIAEVMNELEVVDGKPVRMFGAVHDVTEIRKLREFAEQAQRLETAGRVAGQVAHDFNNLLGPLVAFPELIRLDLPENHSVLPMLASMEAAASQISEINQQLLTLGRRGHYNMEPVNLNEVVEQAVMAIDPTNTGVSISTELHPDLLLARGGRAQIMRVINNLLTNAHDVVSRDGKVRIQTENVTLEQGIPLPGQFVRLTVADNGPGMSSETISHMFDPFFSTKSADRKRGSGLGLSIVHAVMEDHGGMIECETALDEGTSFHLYFPVTDEKLTGESRVQLTGGTESVLIIDDDGPQGEVTKMLLKKLGYNVRVAESGERAIAMVAQSTPDILILDMIMPGMDGVDTYRNILTTNPEQKAIIVSGYAESDRVSAAIELGAGAFVKKPVTLKSIAQAIRTELDTARQSVSVAQNS